MTYRNPYLLDLKQLQRMTLHVKELSYFDENISPPSEYVNMKVSLVLGQCKGIHKI